MISKVMMISADVKLDAEADWTNVDHCLIKPFPTCVTTLDPCAGSVLARDLQALTTVWSLSTSNAASDWCSAAGMEFGALAQEVVGCLCANPVSSAIIESSQRRVDSVPLTFVDKLQR
jgi:hypothetical protein